MEKKAALYIVKNLFAVFGNSLVSFFSPVIPYIDKVSMMRNFIHMIVRVLQSLQFLPQLQICQSRCNEDCRMNYIGSLVTDKAVRIGSLLLRLL